MANFKTSIKATNYELNPEIQSYVDKQQQKFDKVLPEDEEIILGVEVGKLSNHHHLGHIFRAEFNLAYKGKLFRSEETEETLTAAIDLAADEMIRQVRKSKEKRKDLIRKGAAKIKSWIRK